LTVGGKVNEFDGLCVIEPANGAVWNGEIWVRVTPTEMKVLQAIAKGGGDFRTRDILGEEMGKSKDDLKVFVSRIRRKGIPVDGRRGYGYRFKAAIIERSDA
jgi:biotin operon repressor